LPVIRKLGAALRKNDWRATVSLHTDDGICEIVDVKTEPVSPSGYGVAIDIGTTSVVAYLVNLASGAIEACASNQNAQAACGEDVISRIVCSQNVPGCQDKLHRLVIGTLEGLLREIVTSAGIAEAEIDALSIAGNTTMMHLLMQIDPQHIRRELADSIAFRFAPATWESLIALMQPSMLFPATPPMWAATSSPEFWLRELTGTPE
jgi:uncharacterized 2Fe-2S/4Fe-4S cluster protein (DUF4445 family)